MKRHTGLLSSRVGALVSTILQFPPPAQPVAGPPQQLRFRKSGGDRRYLYRLPTLGGKAGHAARSGFLGGT